MEIDATLARRLVASQFPQWAHLPLSPTVPDGWDNRTFRLGDDLLVRLPSAERYVAQVAKEQLWLPRLAPRLPVPIPQPVARGAPGHGYPWPWSVYRWIEGEPLASGPAVDRPTLAVDLAAFLMALHRCDPRGGPAPGPHNFFRGGRLATYDAETRRAVAELGDRIDSAAVLALWEAALATAWQGAPVWVHGDITAGNLLVADGRLAAVIDFGCCGVGDPACDLAIAWTHLQGDAREAFRTGLPLDPDTWARARGWTLWKALIVWAALPGANPLGAERSPRIIGDLLAEPAG